MPYPYLNEYTTDDAGNVYVSGPATLDDPTLTGSHVIVEGPGAAVVTHGADLVFVAPSGSVILAGIQAQPDGSYKGSTGILGTGYSNDVLGSNATLFGGSHDIANVTFNAGTTGALFVTGSGTYNVLGDPTGSHVFIGGGLDHQVKTVAGLVDYGKNGSVTHLFTAGPVSAA